MDRMDCSSRESSPAAPGTSALPPEIWTLVGQKVSVIALLEITSFIINGYRLEKCADFDVGFLY